ncbi:MAG: DUF3788 family protein [Bacteroidales bacterium]|nr:DUF3788 family protein [Bacteroidales bacterium]
MIIFYHWSKPCFLGSHPGFSENHHSDITGEWRYYNDGKSWLYRGLRKEKVIYWVGVHATTFRVTFYLSNKAEALIENSNISDQRKEEFYETAGKKFRHISILMQNMDDVEDVKKLIEIKLKVNKVIADVGSSYF